MASVNEEMKKFKPAKQIMLDAVKDECDKLLAECTPEQVAFFWRIVKNKFPTETNNACIALDLIRRTVVKNRAGR